MTHGMLEEAAWMPHHTMSQIYHQESLVVNLINDMMKDLHAKWLHHTGENPRMRLDRFLMRRDFKTGLLECNMDPFILDLCRECFYWLNLRFSIPIHIQVIYDKWRLLHFVYESVLAITLAYNKILEGSQTAFTRELESTTNRRSIPKKYNHVRGIAVLLLIALSPANSSSRCDQARLIKCSRHHTSHVDPILLFSCCIELCRATGSSKQKRTRLLL
jgi:hypothetical protein